MKKYDEYSEAIILALRLKLDIIDDKKEEAIENINKLTMFLEKERRGDDEK